MRRRLLAAVTTLLSDPSLDGLSDASRLSAIVLLAKSRARTGSKADLQSAIWGAELGRWLGMHKSTVHHTVLPQLRSSGALQTRVATDARGYTTGLVCIVMPLWRAHQAGGPAHPLALSKVELATLLRLIESLFGPGWTPQGRKATPAGVLASRTGRGAATDRLALLLLLLHSRSSGWLRLAGGGVKRGDGRGAATLARLLGCSPSGARKVLSRLERTEAISRVRQQTKAQMQGRSRIAVLPNALPGAPTSSRARDHQSAATGEVRGVPSGRLPRFPYASGALIDQERQPEATGSGGIGSTSTGLPKSLRAYEQGALAQGLTPAHLRQARSADTQSTLACLAKQMKRLNPQWTRQSDRLVISNNPPDHQNEQGIREAGPAAAVPLHTVESAASKSRQQMVRVPLPPQDLRTVLAPVATIWARIERRGARRLVEMAARRELRRVVGLTGPAEASHALAARLARRLSDQLRLRGPIKDPVGWLLSLALPQRQECGDVRCDDRMLLDSGRDCPSCEERQADRRAQRRAITASVDAAMPGARETERRAVIDRQLHEAVTAQAWIREHRWALVREQQAVAKARAIVVAAQSADEVPAKAVTPVVRPAPRRAVVPAPKPELKPVDIEGDQELVLEDLTRQQILEWRDRAAADHQVVHDHIERYGEVSAQRLFTRPLVAMVYRLTGLAHLNLGYTNWRQG